MFVQITVKTLKRKCWKQSQTIKYMFECLMYIFEDRICTFGYLKIPDIILFIVSSQKLEWTHTLAPTSFMRDYFIFDRDTLYGTNLYEPVLSITTNITRFQQIRFVPHPQFLMRVFSSVSASIRIRICVLTQPENVKPKNAKPKNIKPKNVKP